MLYKFVVQTLEALAFLNSQGMCHQDLMPQNIILELISPYDDQGSFSEATTAPDLYRKFKVKLGEYLNIKMLSDIAYQKTMLLQNQAKMAQERAFLDESHR